MNFFHVIFLATAVYCAEISSEFRQSNLEFTLDLLSQVSGDPTKNVVCSGFSLQTVLALTSLGAKGETQSELKNVLHLPSSDAQIKTDYKNIISNLKETKRVVISTANQVYLAKGLEANTDFLKTATEDFNSGVQNLNFGENQKAAQEINSWVEKETHYKIKNLIREDQLSGLTRMVLVNALYFKGFWQHPFDIDDTEKKDFHLSKDKTTQVDTMEITANFLVARNEEHKVTFIRFPYFSQNKAEFSLAIPDEIDGVSNLLKNFKASIEGKNFTREYMTVYLPKFRVETTLELKPILEKMGIQKLFSNPDLSGITKEDVVVDAINQKVFIDVNEDGTEAAAATAVIANTRTLLVGKSTPAIYRADRPFIFGLHYEGITLLTGRVMDPSKQ